MFSGVFVRGSLRLLVVALLLLPWGAWAATPYRLEDRRAVGETAPYRLEKVLVLAIADDRDVRNLFEDKRASHLTARGIGAIASHAIVPDLTAPGDRDRILETLSRERVDAVLTVKATPIDKSDDAAWIGAWERFTAEPSTIRELVQRTLPLPEKRAKRYGIEFALWGTGPGKLHWAARTGACSRKQLSEGVADLLQLALDALKDDRWL